jgi:hypothetical protein
MKRPSLEILLDPDILQWLKQRKLESGASIAELVRRYLRVAAYAEAKAVHSMKASGK